jgi:hypothetical protein
MICWFAQWGETVITDSLPKLLKQSLLASKNNLCIKILKARAGDKEAKVIMEITKEGIFHRKGRIVPIKELRKACECNGTEKE